MAILNFIARFGGIYCSVLFMIWTVSTDTIQILCGLDVSKKAIIKKLLSILASNEKHLLNVVLL
jgi:hypothetical protein